MTQKIMQLFKSLKYSEPVLLEGGVSHWNAISKWTWDCLQEIAGDRQVQLVQGNREQGNTQFVQASLSEYIGNLRHSSTPSKSTLYLKEFDLFRNFPELLADVDFTGFFPWYVTPAQGAWIGPAGATTGLHYDLFNNYLIQVAGDKEIYFFPQSAIPKEYRSEKFDYGARIANVDAFNIDRERFPLLAHIKPLIYKVSAGDILFIPRGWWHQVRSLTPTITVANFQVRLVDRVGTEAWENIRQSLHRAGLYKANNCTCHQLET